MTQPTSFDRESFQQRASALLKDDIAHNGRITPDGIAIIGAEAEFYAQRLARSDRGDLDELLQQIEDQCHAETRQGLLKLVQQARNILARAVNSNRCACGGEWTSHGLCKLCGGDNPSRGEL